MSNIWANKTILLSTQGTIVLEDVKLLLLAKYQYKYKFLRFDENAQLIEALIWRQRESRAAMECCCHERLVILRKQYHD